MDSRDYLKALGRNRLWIAVPVAIGLALAVAASLMTPKRYDATAKVFVSVNYFAGDPASQPPGISSLSDFALGRVQSYAKLATTPAVLVPASKAVGRPIDGGSVTASNPAGTSLVQVTASGDDAARAALDANATARSMIAVIPGLETRLPDGRSTVKATLVEPASAPSSPSRPQPLLYLALGLVLGLASGIALATLREQAFPIADGEPHDGTGRGSGGPSA